MLVSKSKSVNAWWRLRRMMNSEMKNGDDSRSFWYPAEVILARNVDACLVLNTRIQVPTAVTRSLWQNAQLRCTVDGGTNRWRDYLEAHFRGQNMKPPDFITGDFDSITQETDRFFNDPKTRRVHTPDQNATDFTKALQVITAELKSKKNDIVVFHDTSGRLDQIMANINTLSKMQSDSLNVYLISGNSLTWLLRPGKHSIKIPTDLVDEQRWCALLPIGKPCTVTTSGLKWDLKNCLTEFGGLVSTSNTYDADLVQIESDGCLVWTMGLFAFHDD